MALNGSTVSHDTDLSQSGLLLHGWETSPEGLVDYVRIRSAQLNIHVQTEDFRDSPIALGSILLNKARFGSEHDEPDLWDYLEDTALYFLPTLRRFVPHVSHVGRLTLADLQLNQRYRGRLEFYDEVPHPSAIIQAEPEEQDESDCDHCEPAPTTWPFPRFKPLDVEVPYEDATAIFDIVPDKVFVHGQPLFWKPSWISDESKDGVEKYCRIHRSGLSSDELFISRLYGIVIDGKGILRGQLYDWIEIDQYLTWDILEHTPIATREKWVSQIQRTVSSLHAIDVNWGNVKAENIVIDTRGNAIVIDLEGGATRGWIDEDNMGTKRGDLQGLERLVDYILNDGCPLRVREKELDHDLEADDGPLTGESI